MPERRAEVLAWRQASVVMLSEIMSNATCPNCGAALIAGAKFCRQCGRLVSSDGARSVTEATTRTLRTPADFGSQPTDFFAPQPTSPAYLAPNQMPPPPAYNTSNLEQRGQKRSVFLVSMIVALLLVAVVALGIASMVIRRTSVPQPPNVGAPEIPPPPPPPSVPQPPGSTGGATSIGNEFIYPGAETMMEMTRAEGGGMIQLRTKDSYQKVLDWYVGKLKPESTIKSPGQNAVLKSAELIAIINGTGDGTNIMLRQLDPTDIDMDMEEEK